MDETPTRNPPVTNSFRRGDEGVTANGPEWRARRIGNEYMPGRVKRYADAVDGSRCTVCEGLDARIVADTRPETVLAVARDNRDAVSPAGVIRVGVREHGARNRSPRVDEEIAGGRVEPAIRLPDEARHILIVIEAPQAGRNIDDQDRQG